MIRSPVTVDAAPGGGRFEAAASSSEHGVVVGQLTTMARAVVRDHGEAHGAFGYIKARQELAVTNMAYAVSHPGGGEE